MKKTILGSGIYNLDTIVVRDYPEWPRMRPFTDKVVLEEVGGTCGNVMCILAWMGWNAKPLACLDDSPEGRKITEDLKRYGCDCRYVSNTPGGGTTLLRCTHKKTADGKPVMSVRAGSPGGSRFPKRHFLRARDEAPAFLASLEEIPSVFFFDEPSAGNRLLARGLKERGSLVYFEPSRLVSNADFEAVAVSDIIKFSEENIPDVSFVDAYQDKVFIQTMGPRGAQLKLKAQPWLFIDEVPGNKVVDTEGAGDWFSAALIDYLADYECITMDAIRTAQGYSKRSIAFLGSKGYIHSVNFPVVEGDNKFAPEDSSIVIRDIRPEEIPLLDDFLYEAIFIPEGAELPPRSIIRNGDLQVYVRDFGKEPDDRCVVAEVDGKIAGAVWTRIMDDYGHIDDRTPSLAISLYREYRGRGIGTLLLSRMLERLREEGYRRVSLSVQKANYALRMYRKAGFEIVEDRGEEMLMVRQLS